MEVVWTPVHACFHGGLGLVLLALWYSFAATASANWIAVREAAFIGLNLDLHYTRVVVTSVLKHCSMVKVSGASHSWWALPYKGKGTSRIEPGIEGLRREGKECRGAWIIEWVDVINRATWSVLDFGEGIECL